MTLRNLTARPVQSLLFGCIASRKPCGPVGDLRPFRSQADLRRYSVCLARKIALSILRAAQTCGLATGAYITLVPSQFRLLHLFLIHLRMQLGHNTQAVLDLDTGTTSA